MPEKEEGLLERVVALSMSLGRIHGEVLNEKGIRLMMMVSGDENSLQIMAIMENEGGGTLTYTTPYLDDRNYDRCVKELENVLRLDLEPSPYKPE